MNLKYHELLSNLAFNLNLRRYTAVFESIRTALASAKPGFQLGRGQLYVPPKAERCRLIPGPPRLVSAFKFNLYCRSSSPKAPCMASVNHLRHFKRTLLKACKGLKLKYDEPLFNFAYNFNVRRYTKASNPAKKSKKLTPEQAEQEAIAAVEAKAAALAATAAAAGPDAVGTAAALELLREVAAVHAFTAAQVRRVLRSVPWPAAAAEDAAVTLFTRTVDPETGFNAALRSLPAASQMRVGQRLVGRRRLKGLETRVEMA